MAYIGSAFIGACLLGLVLIAIQDYQAYKDAKYLDWLIETGRHLSFATWYRERSLRMALEKREIIDDYPTVDAEWDEYIAQSESSYADYLKRKRSKESH